MVSIAATHMDQGLNTPRSGRFTRPGFRRGRRGFTMIEVMVAIGIILVLMAIGVFGFRYLDKASSNKATHVGLANAESMTAEYEAAGMSITTLVPNPNVAAARVGDVTPGTSTRSTAVVSTQAVMKSIMRVEKNKTFFAGLPPKALVDVNGTRQQVLADGWGNPIIFVPRNGLITDLGRKPDGTTFSKTGVVITNPSNRPFWASAGPDGNFDFGDDNIYSFEK